MLPARQIFSGVLDSPKNCGIVPHGPKGVQREGTLDFSDLDSGIEEDEKNETNSTTCSLSDWGTETDEQKTPEPEERERQSQSQSRCVSGIGFIQECECVLESLRLQRKEYFWSATDHTALEMNVILSAIGFLILRVNGLIQQTSKLIRNPDSELALDTLENSSRLKFRKLCRREVTNLIRLQRQLIREEIRLTRLQGAYLNQLWIQNDFDLSHI
jgi:hypothetical protein